MLTLYSTEMLRDKVLKSHMPVEGIPHVLVSGLKRAKGEGAMGSLLFLAYHPTKINSKTF